jgi:hypothetical protein
MLALLLAATLAADPMPATLAPGVLDPDPAPIAVADDARLKRFVGALVGGVVGAGLGYGLVALGKEPQECPGCGSTASIAAGFATPALTLLGTFVGWQVMGGDGAALAPFAAALPAAVVLGLLLVAVPQFMPTTAQLVPELLVGTLALIALGTLALDLREHQLAGLRVRARGEAPVGRVLAEVGAGLGAALLSGLGAAAVLALSYGSGVVFAVGLGALGAVGAALTTWGVHRAMRGQGGALAALAGMALAAVTAAIALPLGLVGGGLGQRGSPMATTGAILAVAAPTVAVLTFTTLALEWSHAAAQDEASAPAIAVSGSPLPGGGMLAASLRF